METKTLVVPLDGSAYSERALPVAETLAVRSGAGLLLVSAQYHGPLEPQEYLDEMAARVQHCPVDSVATKTAYPAEVISETVEGGDDRTLCMTTHGRGSLRWAALGSVAEDVIRRTRRPVFLVGGKCRPDFLERSRHLLACVDSVEGTEELVPAARYWSGKLGLDLRIAVVVHPLDVESAEHPDLLLEPMAAQFGAPGRVATTMLHSSYVAGALADFADELPAAVVAMSCHARGGLARFALGSVTMAVLHLAPSPLLVTPRDLVPPEGEASEAVSGTR